MLYQGGESLLAFTSVAQLRQLSAISRLLQGSRIYPLYNSAIPGSMRIAMRIVRRITLKSFAGIVAVAVATCGCNMAQTKPGPVDPGVRGGPAGAGAPLNGLTAAEPPSLQDGQARFAEIEAVTGANNWAWSALQLKPVFVLPRTARRRWIQCSAEPPVRDRHLSAEETFPWFLTQMVRSVNRALSGVQRRPRRRGPRPLCDHRTKRRRPVATSTNPTSCPAETSPRPGREQNIIFRIPTPSSARLIEAIPDSIILANVTSNASAKSALGISGHANAHLSGNVNISANDGTITRFGWKAQNASLLIFASEAYNVEMGVTNQLFPQERDQTPGCLFNAVPEDTLNFTTGSTDHRQPQHRRPFRHRSLCQLHANARPTRPCSAHAVYRERTRHLRKDRLRPLPYTLADHRNDDGERLLDRPQRCPFQSNGEPLL